MVASLTAPRFKGRAALLDLAKRGNGLALDALEMTPRERELAVRKGAFPANIVLALNLGVWQEMTEIRHARKALIETGRDVLAARPEGNVIRRATLIAFRRALREAGFRTATHSHQEDVKFVSPGSASVSSKSDSIWASQAGLSGAYQKRAYRVATSEHVWRVSPEILKVPAARRWDGKHLWLTPNLRVRQGRGTTLVSETVR
jgi:hypothetical protein